MTYVKKEKKKTLALTVATSMTFSLATAYFGFNNQTKVYAAVNGDGTDEINEAYSRKLNLY